MVVEGLHSIGIRGDWMFKKCKACGNRLLLLQTSFYKRRDGRCDDCELNHCATEAFNRVRDELSQVEKDLDTIHWAKLEEQHGIGNC